MDASLVSLNIPKDLLKDQLEKGRVFQLTIACISLDEAYTVGFGNPTRNFTTHHDSDTGFHQDQYCEQKEQENLAENRKPIKEPTRKRFRPMEKSIESSESDL